MQFCTTEFPQLFQFEVASCRTCRLRSKKAILEVAMSNLKKNDEALHKAGVLACRFDTPYLRYHSTDRYLRSNFFVRFFLEELSKPKSPFEIN